MGSVLTNCANMACNNVESFNDSESYILSTEQKINLKNKNQIFSFIDEQATMQHFGYNIFETIGKGAYAKVKRGYSVKRNQQVAIKILDPAKTPPDVKRKFLPREAKIARKVKHENIVQCFEVIKANNTIFMILEIVEHGDLLKYVMDKGCVIEMEARHMAKGIVAAIEYLHSQNIAHRDLKLENILLDKNKTPKLSDFGFAKSIRDDKLSSTFCGSTAYAPLEILSGTPYDPYKVDIWSLGIILYAMTVGYLPFGENKQAEKMEQGIHFKHTKQDLSKTFKSLVRSILVNKPNERFSIEQIQSHDWLNYKRFSFPCKQTPKYCDHGKL